MYSEAIYQSQENSGNIKKAEVWAKLAALWLLLRRFAIGTVAAAGLTLEGLQEKLEKRYEPYIEIPGITVSPKKLYTKLGPEFGTDAGKMAIIVRALYGSASSGQAFRDHLGDCI